MKDVDCVEFLQWALPRLRMRWPGFRKVRKQVCKRIDRRLRELGLPDIQAYREYLEAHREEWSDLDTFCRIPISRFYRDIAVFDYLRDDVLPMLASAAQTSRNRNVRCWSAGCASGEEAYTLNIIWKLGLTFRFPNVPLRVIATDSDHNLLERARRGCYSMSSLKDVPNGWLQAAFTRSDDCYCVKPEFRNGIDFVLQDMRAEMPDGRFHLVICRHVAFTYFDEALQQETLRRILTKLHSGGVLVTGKQEPLPMRPAELVECLPHMGIYRKSDIA
jgi:chemotaxis protein methyltransferase CheR